MKGDLDMTEPVGLWSGRNGSRAAHDWAAPPRPRAEAPAPEAPAPDQPSDPRPAASSRGRLRAGAVGALAAALLVGGGVVVGDLTGSDPASRPAAAAPLPAASGGAASSANAGRVYAAVADGVVAVQVGGGSGTGFVIDKRGTIVTNAHVVGESSQASVRFGDSGATIDAEVLGSDPSTDLAVLRVDPSRVGKLSPLKFADSDAVRVGDEVVAIGHPFGLDRTATAGIVSGLGREIQSPNGFSIDEVIQTDAAINPGNSGGPLVDGKGRVVGVNSQIATAGGGGGNVGVGFAVPANTVREVVPRLASGQTIERPFLGVSTAAAAAGVEVQEVTPGGPAQRAGLRSGDVVRSVDGSTVSEPDDITGALDGKQPGDSVTVEVERDGRSQQFDITLGTRPANP
jgi:putative serine protease PepD